MKSVVIGIHGLGGKPPEHVLHSWWLQSMREGAERWQVDLGDLEFELVYWADVLHPVPRDPEVADQESPLYIPEPYVPRLRTTPPSSRGLRRRIASFLEEKFSQVILNDDFTINYESVTDRLIRHYFQDLDAYYSSLPGQEGEALSARQEIHRRLIKVLEKHQGKRILLVAHSMGSIVAFDVLSLNRHLQVDTLVTMGSPLGFPVVIGKIAAALSAVAPLEGAVTIPDGVRRAWYNLADVEDYVAFDFSLVDDFRPNATGVKPIDVRVDNDYVYRRNRNPHKAYGYLRTRQMVELAAGFSGSTQEGWLSRARHFVASIFRKGKAAAPSSAPDPVTPHFLPATPPEEKGELNRTAALAQLNDQSHTWDFVIIGGGATGLGVAVEAASRGYKTLLLEQHDFGKGTSSRSTKLIHGGVRYLQQGNVSLVLEALRERSILRQNAPHLVHDLPFIVPNYDWWEGPFYGVGLRLYDLLAGKHGFGPSVNLSPEETRKRIPQIETLGLRGGVQYHDGQFDDARLVINLAQTAADEGATVINYCGVQDFLRAEGLLTGVVARDHLTGQDYSVSARCVINATGPFTDTVRQMDNPDSQPIMKASRGVHVVLDRSFLGGETAIMVPHTDDGRVLFAIPWQDRVVIGTTDTAVEALDLEPQADPEEIAFILSHAAKYLTHDPTRADIKSVFAGLRPLVMSDAAAKAPDKTAELSREHQILISGTGLVTITGGKWTTYRLMAQETIDQAATLANLDYVPSQTKNLAIHGWDRLFPVFGRLSHYGVDAFRIEALIDADPKLGEILHDQLPISRAMVVWAARQEMAQTVEDVLARRTRCLLLDARASGEIAEVVAKILAEELDQDKTWIKAQVRDYKELVARYLPPGL